MKKIIYSLAFFLLIISASHAQRFSEYGVLSIEEINLKTCAFDKDADAVILMHDAESNYDDKHRLVTYHHVKIKILTEKGFPSASVIIPFYRQDEFETIDLVDGMTLNPTQDNGVERAKLERKSIFTQKENERIGKVVFTFPAVKAGSIVDYKYRSTMKHYGGLDEWVFQDRLPVIKSKFNLVILPNIQFAYRIMKAESYNVDVTKDAGNGSVSFEMRNIPGLGDEPYMDSRNDYLQRVTFQLSGYAMGTLNSKTYTTSWDEAIKELWTAKEFGSQLGKSIPGTEAFIAQVKQMSSPEEKMRAVYNYVRSNMNWNNLYSKYSVAGVKDSWQKKAGNSADINLILTNLLQEVSLDANPMLVSERFHGRVNTTYPFLDQFNSVFTCVTIDKNKYYLDATNKTIPPHLTPVDILNTTALVVKRKGGGLLEITNDAAKFKESIVVDLTVSDDAVLNGQVYVISYDYARLTKLELYKADRNGFLNRYFKLDGSTISPENLNLVNLDNDSLPLIQNGKFSANLNSTGEFLFLPLNLFTGFQSNPFLTEQRFSNVNFGFGRFINLTINLQVPNDYVIDDLLKSIKITNADRDISFTRQLSYNKEKNTVNCSIIFDFTKSLYEADAYPVIREMYQNIFRYLSEPLVLKKKT